LEVISQDGKSELGEELQELLTGETAIGGTEQGNMKEGRNLLVAFHKDQSCSTFPCMKLHSKSDGNWPWRNHHKETKRSQSRQAVKD